MTALATQADVEASLGRTLTTAEEARVGRLLAGASLLARRVSRRPFAAGSYTVARLVRTDHVSIPEDGTVTAVRAVCAGVATAVTDYTVYRKTIYGLEGYRRIEVDYTTSASAPDDVIGAVADMVAAVFSAPGVNVDTETTGPFTVRYRTTAGTLVPDGVALATLRAYAAGTPGAVNLL